MSESLEDIDVTKKVLHIEDEENNKVLVRRILTARGYEVIEADNGLEGIEKAILHHPDLVLIDINMPGLDGYETTTRLRGTDGLAGIPIIAVSARASEDERDRGLIAGCDGYITKPIDVDSFAKTVERYLGGEREYVEEAKEKELLRDYSQYLVKSLEDKVKKLENVNEELERRVEERTKALKKARKRLVTLERKKTLLELAGAAAHELNQPLTVLMSLSEIILSDPGRGEENYNLVLRMRDECDRMAGIVKKMGNVSTYKTKKYYRDIDIVDLDESSG